MYQPAPGVKCYRLTRRLFSGYAEHRYFPANDQGLAKATRAWQRAGRTAKGRRTYQLELIEGAATK